MNNAPKYVRRRATVALVVLLAPIWLIATSLTQPAYSCDQATVIVEQGDSLWSIAEQHCKGDLREVTYNLDQKYGLTIHPGQVIEMP